MTKERDYVYWHAEVARLEELRKAQEARRLELQRELQELDARRGTAAIAALNGGDAEREALAALVHEIAEQRERMDTVDSLLKAASDLVAAAKAKQRPAVAAELRRQADVAEAEWAKTNAKAVALFKELQELGYPAMAIPGGPAQHAAQRPEQLRNAADQVERNGPRAIDPTTGRDFDADLW